MSKGLAAIAAVLCLTVTAAAQEEEGGPPAPPTEQEIASVPLDAPDVKALAILVQSHTSIEESVTAGELGQVHNEDVFLYAALGLLRKAAEEAGREHVVSALQAAARAVADVHEAADAFDRALAKARLEPMGRAFQMVYDFHDRVRVAAARRVADVFTCPMHPEIVGKRTDSCGKCAMVLDVPARLRLQPSTSTTLPRLVYAKVRPDQPLEVGRPVGATLVLQSRIEQPLQLFELREVHEKKIHLLVIDESLTDYHHEHPVPGDKPGEYRFTFTPRAKGPYRAWADVQPLLTGVQEYAMADIPAPDGAAGGSVEKTFPRTGAVEGLRYDLSLGAETIRAGQPASARVHITGAGGKPFAGLEPLMGAFAHLVGFHEDRQTILHMHPIESRKLAPSDRGGPDLEFRLYTDTPGYYRLFLQVQIGGASKFVPFGVEVVPGL